VAKKAGGCFSTYIIINNNQLSYNNSFMIYISFR